MIAVGHTATGVLIGALVASTASDASTAHIGLAFVLGMLAHYVGDALPHGHYAFNLHKQRARSLAMLFFDLFLPFVLFSVLAFNTYGVDLQAFIIISAMIGANTPDVFEELVNLGVLRSGSFGSKHRQFHYDLLHWHNDPASPLPNGARPLSWSDAYLVILVLTALAAVS